MSNTENSQNDMKAKTMLAGTAAIWGAGFIASQLALDAHLSPAAIMLGRFGLAALLMLLFFSRSIRTNFDRSQLKGAIFIGVILFAAFYVQTFGLLYSSPSNNAFITAANVVMVPFLWWVVSGKRPQKIFFFASVLCLIGVGILSLDVSGSFSFIAGDLLTLLCAFLFACHITATAALSVRMDFRVLVFVQLLVAAVCAFFVFLFTDRDLSGFTQPSGIYATLFLGIFSTTVCYLLQTKAQSQVSSSTAAIILSAECLFGALFSIIAGYDEFTLTLVFGGGIIFVSVILPDIFNKFTRRNTTVMKEDGV